MSAPSERFDVEPSVGNHFAWMRTTLGLQRTLMAAVRTSVSLIGFGFTVAQFFEKLRDKTPPAMNALGINVPRDLGLLLIGAGVISLLTFTLQYHASIAYLRSGDFNQLAAAGTKSLHKPTVLVAWVVTLIGVAAFVSVLVRF